MGDMDKLSTWLATELRDRSWSMRELARRADISHTQIGNVINGQAAPSADFCIAIARAMQIPAENVLRLADLLPSLPPAVEEEREIVAILRRLPAGARRTVTTMLRGLAGQAPTPAMVGESAENYIADGILISEFLDRVRQLPGEQKEGEMPDDQSASPDAQALGQELLQMWREVEEVDLDAARELMRIAIVQAAAFRTAVNAATKRMEERTKTQS